MAVSETVEPKKRGRGRPPGAVQRLTVKQVSELLAMPLQTIYTYTRQRCADGTPVLPKRKYGRAVRILQTDVDKLEERLASRRPALFFAAKSGGVDNE